MAPRPALCLFQDNIFFEDIYTCAIQEGQMLDDAIFGGKKNALKIEDKRTTKWPPEVKASLFSHLRRFFRLSKRCRQDYSSHVEYMLFELLLKDYYFY
jgi:hypothetical protein